MTDYTFPTASEVLEANQSNRNTALQILEKNIADKIIVRLNAAKQELVKFPLTFNFGSEFSAPEVSKWSFKWNEFTDLITKLDNAGWDAKLNIHDQHTIELNPKVQHGTTQPYLEEPSIPETPSQRRRSTKPKASEHVRA